MSKTRRFVLFESDFVIDEIIYSSRLSINDAWKNDHGDSRTFIKCGGTQDDAFYSQPLAPRLPPTMTM